METATSIDLMHAVVQHRYGSEDTLQVSETNRPVAGPDEVLIAVHAAGIDRGVWHLMAGMPYLVRLSGYGFSKPKQPIPGLDVAGIVVGVGDAVTRFEVGDAVFGIARGSFAEYAVAEESKLSHKPDGITFAEAGVAAISGITALQAVEDQAEVAAGQRVLVIGASGGVGSYAVQLAKAKGASVTGVASKAKASLVTSLGADNVIDYQAGEYLDGSVKYDVIIDTGGRNPVRKLRRALHEKGTLVIVGGEGGGKFTGGIGRQLRAALLSPLVSQRLGFFISEEHHRHIDRLAQHLATREVVAAVGRSYSLDSVPEAIRDLVAGRATGKSVVVIDSEGK